MICNFEQTFLDSHMYQSKFIIQMIYHDHLMKFLYYFVLLNFAIILSSSLKFTARTGLQIALPALVNLSSG